MQGKIPAVLYGPGGETIALAVDPAALTKAITTPFRRNVLIQLDVGGQKQFATVKDLDIHPVSRAIRHADFYRVALENAVVYQIPLRTVGRAKGVVKGGELRVHFRSLPLKVAPENLDMNESIRVKDIKLENGELQLPAERAVVFLSSEVRKVAEEEPAPGAPAAAAPAAAAAAPAAKAPAKK
jgi:large subunit ribosomal protein L25